MQLSLNNATLLNFLLQQTCLSDDILPVATPAQGSFWERVEYRLTYYIRLLHLMRPMRLKYEKGIASIHKFLIGSRFHVTLRIVSPIICKQC